MEGWKGTTIVAKAPSAVNREGYFSKEGFQLDARAGTLTCPGGQPVRLDPARLEDHRAVGVRFPEEACRACRLKARCTPAAARHVTLHPYEVELREARAIQKTPAFQARYRLRPRIERIVRLLKTHGARKERFIGKVKVHLQLLLAAINHNIKEGMAAGPCLGEACPV